jgi:hypothetical protein
MHKFCKTLFFSSQLLLLMEGAYGQDTTGFYKNITEKFRNYCESVPREEIFIQTDRSEYVAGELLWFKLYLINRQSTKPSLNSSLAYFELLNSENRPIVQKRIKIENGNGPGQITLPDTLSTGTYTIRAYTNWMKNFLPHNCFIKKLNIYNAFTQRAIKRTAGKESLAGFAPDSIPYYRPPESGFGLRVNNLVPDTLIIDINADDNFRSGNRNFCYLFIQTHGIINLIKTVKLSSSGNRIELDKEILIPGINHITLFNSRGEPLAERYICTPSEDVPVLTLGSPERINIRNKISLEIGPTQNTVTSFNTTDLSVSVSPVSDNEYAADLTQYMIFGTEFGILPDEIRYCNLKTLSPEFVDNFLLTVKSNWIDWHSILNETTPHLSYKAEKDDHYVTGTLLNKNADKPLSNKCLFISIPDKTPTFQYARSDINGRFVFHVPADECIRNLIIQPEEADMNSTIRIESSFSEEYAPVINIPDTCKGSIPGYISKWSTNYQVSRIYELADQSEPLNRKISVPKAKRFYGRPDLELLLADYIKLPSMEEVFFELTPGIIFKHKKSGYSVSVFDPVNKAVYDKPPVLFVDGVVINDPAVIAGLDPGLVEKIDLVNELYLVGDYCFFGIVNVITLAGDFSCVNLPPYAVRLNYRAVDQVRTFLSPDYSTDEMKLKRIPDFRNTLYWNPSVRPDTDGKIRIDFWAPDGRGNYEIQLEGLSDEGTPVSLRKIIRVE